MTAERERSGIQSSLNLVMGSKSWVSPPKISQEKKYAAPFRFSSLHDKHIFAKKLAVPFLSGID